MARMTWYLTSKRAYAKNLRPIGRVYREVMGRHFPAMSVLQVVALIEDRAQVEIEVTAVIPDAGIGDDD
jgi:enamine deaminase RidA (YjgF/YER057c/UK114 family)